jgi:sec-independent protein translocase protein TatA
VPLRATTTKGSVMGSLGVGEIVGIIVILVLLFGAKKLPELGSSVGKGIKNFKRGLDEASEDDDRAESDDEQVRSDHS